MFFSLLFHCYSCYPLLSQGKTISPCGVFVLIGALKQAGYNAADLKEAQFTATQLKEAQFPARQLQHAGFDLETLKHPVFCEAAQDYETCPLSHKRGSRLGGDHFCRYAFRSFP